MAMSVGQAEEEGSSIAEITTPLVDIMLVLLTSSLITVPVIQDMKKVDIPKAVNIPTQTKPENITILVDSGHLLECHAMSDKQVFFQRIVAEARRARSLSFTSAVTRTHVTRRRPVIFNLQRGGIVKVGFITEPDKGSIRVTR
jgi:biopolymer transport protein ExbD